MSELRECPLCASADVVVVVGAVEFTDAEVQCKECGAQTGNYHGGTVDENKAAAIAAWNRRATPAEVEALRAERDAVMRALGTASSTDLGRAVADEMAKNVALRARVVALEGALKPFAAIAEEIWGSAPDDIKIDDVGMEDEVTVGMCRAARAALGDTP